jgi:hypothetical protein
MSKKNASFASVNRAYDFYVRARQRGYILTHEAVNIGQDRRRERGVDHHDRIGKHTYDTFTKAWDAGFRCREWPGINNFEYREGEPDRKYRDRDRGYE